MKISSRTGNQVDFLSHLSNLGTEFTNKFGKQWSAISLEGDQIDHDSNNKFVIGSKLSWVPDLGKVIWELPQTVANRVSFSAKIYELENDLPIGYIRIPYYEYDESEIEEFSKVIAYFENETQLLILDQMNNPGGSLFQMYSILSCLTDRPLTPPKHVLTLSDEDAAMASEILEIAEAGDEIPPDDRPSPESVSYSRFVLSEIEAGRKRFTNPTYLWGVSEILPANNHYTKKIFVLINELTFSAPEFLAAILQDNHRATLFGEKTPGAGGCVKRFTPLGSEELGINYMTITWTMAYRKNGQTIESVGVTPDISYLLTDDDLVFGFLDYRDALLSAING